MRYVIYEAPTQQPVSYTGSLYDAQVAASSGYLVEDTITGLLVRSKKQN